MIPPGYLITLCLDAQESPVRRYRYAALNSLGPVIFMEHKLLSENWLEFLGSRGRTTVEYDILSDVNDGPVPHKWEPIPLGSAFQYKEGNDLTIDSVGVGVHRSPEAREVLSADGISVGVIDLRCITPLDTKMIIASVSQTGYLLVVDEDYESYGLVGEMAAMMLEAGISVKFGHVCTQSTIPYTRHFED